MKANIITQDKSLIYITLTTGSILLIPLIAMQFTEEVVWTLGDFVAMGTLLFGTGIFFVLAARKLNSKKQKLIVGIIILAAFLYIWAELAVGIFTNLGS
jgi:hypothetical protein